MTESKAMCPTAVLSMWQALARWEQDGGALARTTLAHPDVVVVPSNKDMLLAEVALREGMLLQRCDENGAAHYRLVARADAQTRGNDALDFALTLDDVETILLNRNPA